MNPWDILLEKALLKASKRPEIRFAVVEKTLAVFQNNPKIQTISHF